MPTPTAEGLEPMAYPEYPSPVTADAAESFAEAFERAHQHNRFLAEDFIVGTDTVLVSAGVPDGYVIERDDGILVGVNSTIATEDNERSTEIAGTETHGTAAETPTSAPAYDNEFAAVYLVGGRVARRVELAVSELPDEGPESVDLALAKTVACA